MKLNKIKEFLGKKLDKEKMVRFLDKQGFYILLFLCIIVIGLTALWTSDFHLGGEQPPKESMEQEEPEDEAVVLDDWEDNLVDIEIQDVINVPESQKSDSTEEVEEGFSAEAEGPDIVENAAQQEDGQKSSPAPELEIVLTKPVMGEILVDYAVDELVYSRTLREYCTHPGIDIECPIGSEVKAAMAGTIESIEEDPLMGIVITMDHGNGLKTLYANLSTKDMVQEGQQIAEGQTISGVGRTAICEIADAPHLHFEVIKDGENKDPKEFFAD